LEAFSGTLLIPAALVLNDENRRRVVGRKAVQGVFVVVKIHLSAPI